MTERTPGFATLAIHAGAQPDPTTGARATPIYQTTSFVFDDVDHAASLFGLQAFGNIYTRIGNPTNAVLEERIAALEGGTAGLAVASGHAAQVLVFHCLMKPGDEFVASRKLYGGSINQFNHAFKNFGWNVVVGRSRRHRLVRARGVAEDQGDLHRVRSPIRAASSPTSRRSPTSRARAGVPLIVDNTLATPYLCKPIDYGADVVVHSLTKFLGGHGNSIGGMIVDGGTFNWSRENRYPMLSRAAARIQRHRAARDLRQFRLRHRLPGAEPARHRAGAVAVQRVPDPDRRRDAAAAHAAPLRQRQRGRALAVAASAASPGSAIRAWPATAITTSPRNTRRRAPARCSPSGSRAATTPASSSSRTSSCSRTSPTSATPAR